MPKPNEALSDFFSDNDIFADLFNAYAFQGKQVLHAGDLQDADTAYVQSVKRVKGIEKIGRYRDIVRKSALGADYVLLGLELQDRIHYAMPVRAMLYDALGYVTECRALGSVQEQTGWTADEYLSGLTRGTRLTPVFTLVFYTGEAAWDGPVSLYDMLAMDERLKPFISDYPLNLIDVGHFAGKLPFRTKPLQELFYILPAIYDESGSADNTELSGSVVSLAGILAGSEKLYRIGKEGDVAMCRALEKLEQAGEQKGIQKGEQCMIGLVRAMQADGRLEELNRVLQDAGYRRQLYLEYGIDIVPSAVTVHA